MRGVIVIGAPRPPPQAMERQNTSVDQIDEDRQPGLDRAQITFVKQLTVEQELRIQKEHIWLELSRLEVTFNGLAWAELASNGLLAKRDQLIGEIAANDDAGYEPPTVFPFVAGQAVAGQALITPCAAVA